MLGASGDYTAGADAGRGSGAYTAEMDAGAGAPLLRVTDAA